MKISQNVTRKELPNMGILEKDVDELLYFRQYLIDTNRVSKTGFRSVGLDKIKEYIDYENGVGGPKENPT